MREKIVTIEGPTAVGKSSLGVWLARQLGHLPAGRQGEIISADSRQVYRGLDIGTEKITREEMGGVPHHLIDIADPQNTYTAADFKRDAEAAIHDIRGRGNLPIVVGGTGFYVHVLVDDVSLPDVPPNDALRTELSELDAHVLFEKLTALDPTRAQTIDPDNPRRLIRAIEIATARGAVPLIEHGDSPHDAYRIGLSLSDDVLRERITTRLHDTLARGLIEETKALHEGGLSWERLDELGLEYRLCAQFLRGELAYDELEEQLATKLWQYAKRQKTWLRRDARIHWYNPADREAILADIRTFLARSK